jgi:hypothetical protein
MNKSQTFLHKYSFWIFMAPFGLMAILIVVFPSDLTYWICRTIGWIGLPLSMAYGRSRQERGLKPRQGLIRWRTFSERPILIPVMPLLCAVSLGGMLGFAISLTESPSLQWALTCGGLAVGALLFCRLIGERFALPPHRHSKEDADQHRKSAA